MSVEKGISFNFISNLLIDSESLNESNNYFRQNILQFQNGLIPYQEIGKYLEILCDERIDFRMGLKLGLHSPLSSLGSIGQIYMSCNNLQEVLEKMEMYICNIDNINQYSYEIDDKYLIIKTKGDENWRKDFPIAERQVIEHNIGFSIRHKREYLGKEIKPIMIWSPYPKEGKIDLLETFFSCPIYFDKPYMAIFHEKKILEYKIPTANKHALEMFENHLSQNAPEKTWVARVSYLIEQQYKIGIPNEEMIARQLCISKRNLQRHLKKENSSFTNLINNLKFRIAKYYLLETNISIQEISDILEFSIVNSFHRFYKSQSGRTPKEERLLNKK